MSDCIEWGGARDKKGYGIKRVPGERRNVLVHRQAFFDRHGYWPNICRHTCDNPPCYNADHLLDGTKADNARDMVERHEGPWWGVTLGSDAPNAKLTESKVAEMRELYAAGMRQTELARLYGVSQSNVSLIVRGEGWKHV